MFACNGSLRRKPNTLSEFTRIFDKEVIPMLRKQSGFRDEITFAVPGELDVVAISLWDTKEYAEAYNTAGYPEVLKILDKVLDGTPKVQVSDVLSSTIYTPAAVAACDGASTIARGGYLRHPAQFRWYLECTMMYGPKGFLQGMGLVTNPLTGDLGGERAHV